jgi:hypothetical protein
MFERYGGEGVTTPRKDMLEECKKGIMEKKTR